MREDDKLFENAPDLGLEFDKHKNPNSPEKNEAERLRDQMRKNLVAEEIRNHKNTLEHRPDGNMRREGDAQMLQARVRQERRFREYQIKREAAAEQQQHEQMARQKEGSAQQENAQQRAMEEQVKKQILADQQHQKDVAAHQRQVKAQEQVKPPSQKPGSKLDQASVKLQKDFKEATSPPPEPPAPNHEPKR